MTFKYTFDVGDEKWKFTLKEAASYAARENGASLIGRLVEELHMSGVLCDEAVVRVVGPAFTVNQD